MDNVIPAIPNTNEKTLKELSPQEFQQMLSSWFQEKGIVQDMKSYLKFQMISVLKNTAIGKNIKKNANQTFTLAQQAMHLIVAEYLLHHQCHFALSLFSTEVNLSNILPETKVFFDSDHIIKEAATRFDKENLINILGLIGISKERQCCMKLIHEYFEESRKPLLSCLLGLIGKDAGKATDEEDYKMDVEFEDDFMKNVCLVLESSNLPLKTRMHLFHNLKVCYELKTKSYESQVVKLVNKFKTEVFSIEQKLQQSQKRKRCLEKRLLKLREENQALKERIDVISNAEKPVQNENIVEKVIALECSLCHCSEKCINNRRLCESYKKEIEKLKSINNNQREEIERLSSNCNELVKEFTSCQSKINLVNSRLQENMVPELQKGCHQEKEENLSLSSDSLTEEILQQARQKLKLLEEESEELDIRFSNFVIK